MPRTQGDDLSKAIFASPVGPLLCCVAADGFVLYSPDEWECCDQACYEADRDGNVTFPAGLLVFNPCCDHGQRNSLDET